MRADMVELIVTVVAALTFWVLLSLCVLPLHRRHWFPRLRRFCSRAVRRVRRGPPPSPDPFAVLRVQSRLGVIATEIRALEDDPFAYAKMRRLEALRAAYDDLLDEGCRLAGVEAFEDPDREVRRWHEEQELTERGWTW